MQAQAIERLSFVPRYYFINNIHIISSIKLHIRAKIHLSLNTSWLSNIFWGEHWQFQWRCYTKFSIINSHFNYWMSKIAKNHRLSRWCVISRQVSEFSEREKKNTKIEIVDIFMSIKVKRKPHHIDNILRIRIKKQEINYTDYI